MYVDRGAQGGGESGDRSRGWPGPSAGAITEVRQIHTANKPDQPKFTTLCVRVHWEVSKKKPRPKGEAFLFDAWQ